MLILVNKNPPKVKKLTWNKEQKAVIDNISKTYHIIKQKAKINTTEFDS
jgi:hypothetical protein